jgi:hypothetical protein
MNALAWWPALWSNRPWSRPGRARGRGRGWSARENITGDEAAAFRQNFATQHRQAADRTLKAAIDALGRAGSHP